MSQSICYRIAGPTQTLSVLNVSTQAVTVTSLPNEVTNFAGFLNVGASPVLISVVTVGAQPNPIFPTITGGPVVGFVLPALMQSPMLVSVPNQFIASGISNSTLASQVYITPMVAL